MADREVLPDYFKPAHYGLVIDDLDFENWTYQGRVTIEGALVRPTRDILLNTLEIKLKNAKITLHQTKGEQAVESTTFSYGNREQRVTISFDGEELIPSAKAVLVIEFEGTINHDMAGFYRSQYKPVVPAAASVPRDSDWHYMMSTQFESCDARRAFPCFDEPNLKATFDLSIEIPDDQTALSNMPVRETTPTKPGRKLVAFERTPVMSTYLLAWAVGDLEYVEAFTERRYNGKRLPVRVYTTRGLKEQGNWALQHATKTIDFFSEIFEIDYPLPKSDILAVHEFTHAAMENWGLVTYRMTAILFDEKLSEARFRMRIAYVVAHELAHQWFGDLVTMDWWDELWLNEGFATWAGWLAIDHLHPDWDVWAVFVNEDMDAAFKLDSIRASHPIQVPVRDALDVNQVFDAISYRKGCSVIRMLANHLGVKTFLKGVAIYLKKHKYGNAKTEALWSALSEASGTDVNALMSTWIGKTGHPVLTVAEEPGQITVRQSRFLSTGDVKPEDDETIWWVPLALQGKVGTSDVTALALTSREETIRDISDDFYKLNDNATGFYRVNYPPPRLAKLGTQLGRLSVEDKICITGSAADLAFAGDATTAGLLSFLQGFNTETHYRVLNMALESIGTVKSVFAGDKVIRKGLEAFTLRLIDSALAKIGWEFPDGEDYNGPLLRKRLLLSAVANGHSGATAEAIRRFTAYRADPSANPLHPDLRIPVFRAAVKSDPAQAVPFLKHEWSTTPAVDGREICLQSLGHVTDATINTDSILPFLFGLDPSSAVPPGDMHILANGMAGNAAARPLLWAYMKEHWDEFIAKVGGNPIVLDRFVRVALQKFSDLETLADIEKFFDGKDTKAFDRTLETVKDKIRGRAAYRERDATVLREWLEANGYA